MVKIAGYWDLWFSHRENEYDVSWRFMLKHFGVEQAILIPNVGARVKIPLDYTEVPLLEMDSIQDVLEANPEYVPIFVDECGRAGLKEFSHPEKCLYIFGRTGFSPLGTCGIHQPQSIFIEGVPKHAGVGLLHPNQACSIVLYDRLAKSWQ